MQIYDVKTIYPGIAFAEVYKTVSEGGSAFKTECNRDVEKERYLKAKKLVKDELDSYRLKETSRDIADILDAYAAMLEDEEYDANVYGIIESEGASAEYAVDKSLSRISSVLTKADDETIKSRVNDVADISAKIKDKLNKLSSGGKEDKTPEDRIILISEQLSVTDILRLGKSRIAGLVSLKDTAASHASIVAASLKIPTVVINNMYDLSDISEGMAVIDGYEGKVYIDPDEKMVKLKTEALQHKQIIDRDENTELNTSSLPVNVYANIQNVSEIEEAFKKGAKGIGLFRTEFLFLLRSDYPSEEEQFEVYKEAAQKSSDREVIIRTIDIGSDKKADYFNLEDEENPALGLRGIRLCLEREDIFKTQLRALLRSSAFGNISIMFPMISSVDEAERTLRILEDVKEDLKNKGIAFNENIKTGTMIETPAAAVEADVLAGMFDFFSVGSNDLTQFTLAVDRQNRQSEKYYNPKHPAVLKLIEQTIEAAHRNNIKVTICGELAADTSFTKELVKMGFDGLSVSLPMLNPLIDKLNTFKEEL